MPRGRPKSTSVQETPQGDSSPQDQVLHTDQESLNMSVAQYIEYFQLDAHPQEMVEDFIAKLTREQALAQGMQTLIIPASDRVAMPEGTPEPVQNFIEYFELHRFFQRDELVSQIDIMTSALRMEQSAAEVHAEHQEQVPAPDEQQSPIPLNVRIASLEMDGDTRALATAEYGDLTIRRIRVKEDEHGALSVVMPKYREAGGWKETCRFNSVEARNRLTGAVFSAYEQTTAQIQAQNSPEAQGNGQGMDQSESTGPEEPEQSGPVMGGMTL